LRELEPGARKVLCRPQLPAALREPESDIAGPCPLKAPDLGSLYERFRTLEDPRGGHGLHHRAASHEQQAGSEERSSLPMFLIALSRIFIEIGHESHGAKTRKADA
jgi:hypothetical protein